MIFNICLKCENYPYLEQFRDYNSERSYIFCCAKRGGYSMKSKTIILILILVACIFVFYQLVGNNRNELSELGTPVQNITLEYKSEREFGNDRFDIYSYSLECEVNFNNDYANLEAIYQKEFSNIFNTESKKNQALKEKQNQIENLLKEKRFIYKYVVLKGTKKLYLYNTVLNKGYCLIVTI